MKKPINKCPTCGKFMLVVGKMELGAHAHCMRCNLNYTLMKAGRNIIVGKE